MKKYGLGALPSPKDIRDYKLSATAIASKDLPESFKLKPARIKDQGMQPTCVAHAMCSLIEYYNLRDTHTNSIFSTDFIYGCRTDDDYLGEGMYLRDGLKVIQHYGDVLYSILPGNTDVPTARQKVWSDFENLSIEAFPNRISTYYKIQSFNELKYAIYTGGPVPAVMSWFSDADLDSKNVYDYSSDEIDGYHAVLIIGWNKNNLIIQNSWGKEWGNNGLFYIPINKIDEVFYEFYGVTDNINDVIKPNIFVKKFSWLINFILKLFNSVGWD